MTVAISTVTHAVYPPRVVVSLTGLTVGDQLVIYREVDSNRTALRGGSADSATDTAFVVVDAELPFGVPMCYVAVVNGTDEYTSATTTYTLPGGKVALSDAITGLSAEVTISAIGEKSYGRDSARFRVGGRNLVVSGPMAEQAEGSYELLTETITARDNVMALLAAATEGIVQIRQPGTSLASGDPYEGIDAYLAVDGVTERRYSQDGSDPKRLITIEFAEVDGWADELLARGFSYGEVEDYYSGLTYADVAADFPTYFEALQADYS